MCIDGVQPGFKKKRGYASLETTQSDVCGLNSKNCKNSHCFKIKQLWLVYFYYLQIYSNIVKTASNSI